MADEPGHYEAELGRVRGGSGARWILIWIGGAALVVAIGVGGALLAPGPSKAPVAAVTAAASPELAASRPPAAEAPAVADLPPLDITSGASGYAAAFAARWRRGVPLVVESTDFYGNGGSAYYGIGGRLIRALAPIPTPRPSGTPAP